MTFTPAANFNGAASFSYTATDGLASSNTATVTINVAAVNDAPVADDDTLAAVEDTPAIYTAAQLLGNDTDVDGNTADDCLGDERDRRHRGAQRQRHGDVHAAANFNGAASFSYTATDGLAAATPRP